MLCQSVLQELFQKCFWVCRQMISFLGEYRNSVTAISGSNTWRVFILNSCSCLVNTLQWEALPSSHKTHPQQQIAQYLSGNYMSSCSIPALVKLCTLHDFISVINRYSFLVFQASEPVRTGSWTSQAVSHSCHSRMYFQQDSTKSATITPAISVVLNLEKTLCSSSAKI